MQFNGAETLPWFYHWTLGLVMREQNTKLITLISNHKSQKLDTITLPHTDALISSARYVGLAGSGLGVEADPQTKIFSHQCGGHL